MGEATLDEMVAAVRAHPGLTNKAAIGLVREVLGEADWYGGPGDDGAVIADGDANLVVGGEAMWPPFVEADPYGSGIAAVLANVNDLGAMGAVPLAIVDTVIGPERVARAALEGMRHAGRLYQVPVVGGHLTVREGPASISAFGLGRATSVLSARHAAPGQRLILACCADGTLRGDFPFFASFEQRGTQLGGDVRVLAQVAGEGWCVAAKDVSMAGIMGSLAMLLECAQLGVTLDLDTLPRPHELSLTSWLCCFPCFAFLLCSPPGREGECMAAFTSRGLQAAVIGTLDGSGEVRIGLGGESRTVMDLRSEPVTGLGPTRATAGRQASAG